MSMYSKEHKNYYNFDDQEVLINNVKVQGMMVEYCPETGKVLIKTVPNMTASNVPHSCVSFSPLEQKVIRTSRICSVVGTGFILATLGYAGVVLGEEAYAFYRDRVEQIDLKPSHEEGRYISPFTHDNFPVNSFNFDPFNVDSFTIASSEAGTDDYNYNVQKGDTATHIAQQLKRHAELLGICYLPINANNVLREDGKPVGDHIEIGERVYIQPKKCDG